MHLWMLWFLLHKQSIYQVSIPRCWSYLYLATKLPKHTEELAQYLLKYGIEMWNDGKCFLISDGMHKLFFSVVWVGCRQRTQQGMKTGILASSEASSEIQIFLGMHKNDDADDKAMTQNTNNNTTGSNEWVEQHIPTHRS